MKRIPLAAKFALALVMAGALTAGPVMADKDSNGDKGSKHDRGDQRDERRDDNRKSKDEDDRHASGNKRHFEERQYVVVREYYDGHYRGRRCPPGLARKHNGCMPPGHAKQWQIGRPLAREVIYYEVPQPLVVQIGLPPAGHRYVRVAGDILMIAIGTGVVVDAINDLGRM